MPVTILRNHRSPSIGISGHLQRNTQQIRDMKVTANLDTLPFAGFVNYAHYCGWPVARAHAKAGDAAMSVATSAVMMPLTNPKGDLRALMPIRPSNTTPPWSRRSSLGEFAHRP